MNNKFQFLTGVSLALTLAVIPGCKNDGTDDEDTGNNGSTTNTNDTETPDSTGPGATSMDSNTGDSGDTDTPATTDAPTTDDPTTNGGCSMDAELGSACAMACDCASDACFVVGPLGGVCSECDEDADCADSTGFGCNFGNPLTGTPAVCSTTGEIGESCETVDACAEGLFCPTLIEVPGILSASTCSECESDADCTDQECAPTYDIANIGGFFQCVDPMSVPNDEGCDLTGDGSECQSEQCAPASIMGIPVVGVCSPCNEDADCPGGTCQLPEVAIEGTSLALVPGACV